MTTNPTELTIVMPKLGLTMTEATLTRWRKAAGETVRRDEIIFDFESEKSVMEYECPTEGVLAEQLVAEGQTVPCGTPVAIIQTGERAAAPAAPPSTQAAEITATPAAKRLAHERGIDWAGLAGSGPEGRVQLADVEAAAHRTVTPVAERMASELGLDWTQVAGSGPGGRVRKADVAAAAPAPVTPSTLPQPPLVSGPRAVIARRMSESAFTAPHVTLFTEADATALVEARRQLNAELSGQSKISYNTLLMAMVARLLPEHPALNAGLIEGEIYLARR